ncbi:solute carrier family 25 member 24, like [Brienomyrus brachyistius]|uniref:solute carrier family 25 member 24, like n=1 Tax=Brienomyrus brachyistius TaxID=42636 RepID=UPI0020B2C18D|nr:solute carrier family 25 member 24, like [Brienomyrus brachyistius]XP_048845237.1 solute carrier family 25 member 24, like [Brienomyrus brachyistius]XP_048845238.1 solute carrier family 25 member 24, like [Brienomyrus brachyistius]XP_048845239.1 solute carrier family 25 member 24, like [Brienomyrus brachyistius]
MTQHISLKGMDRFRSLFLKLDRNNDGYISVDELHKEMEKIGVLSADQKAQGIVGNYDQDGDGRLDYNEFLSYMQDRERKWRINFNAFDRNKCGVICQEEIIILFKELGLVISKKNAEKIIQMMDEDHSMTVDWGEFLQHVVLNPVEDIRDLVLSWQRSTVFDVGEGVTLPMEFSQQDAGSGAIWKYIFAAGLADAMSRTLTAPIDRLKTQLQVYGSKTMSPSFKEVRFGAFKSMWQGNMVNVLKGTPQSTLQYVIYSQMKSHTQAAECSLTVPQRFGLGCLSGAAAHAVFYPLEVLKVRLNLQPVGTSAGVLGCARALYHSERLSAFYRGFRPSVMCMIPYAGVECAVHQSIISWAKTDPANSDESKLFLFSFVAFACGQTASYPLAVIRTQQQAQALSVNPKASSALQGLQSIYTAFGIRGFYNGMGASFVKALPCAILNYTLTPAFGRLLSSDA